MVREAGTNEAEGKIMFEEAGIDYHGDDITLTQAAQRMVEKMRLAYPDYDSLGGSVMAILVDKNSKVVIQGITGREASMVTKLPNRLL